MSTIVTIQATDLITNSRADINSNFSNLNTDKIETSTLDTDTSLAANSDSKIATQKAVKAYVDAGGNVNASTTARGIVEQATAAEVAARSTTGGTGAPLFVNPGDIGQIVKFGGTGADGALSIPSGTTPIDCSNASIVVKNYTSISITGTGKLAFSNPNTNGTLIILKSQGAVTLTSSQAPMIDASGMGGVGGAGGNTNTSGSNGNFSGTPIWITNLGQGGQYHSAAGTGGALPTNKLNSTIFAGLYTPYLAIAPGAGGGGGESATVSATGGNGGNGGAALVIECGGALNFTTSSGISVNGANGANGTPNATNTAGGGGGGGGGTCLILYNSLTAASGTVTVAGGTGGNCVSAGGTTYGGGGGASSLNAGSNGSSSATNGAKTGGDGGAGAYSIVQNFSFS